MMLNTVLTLLSVLAIVFLFIWLTGDTDFWDDEE